MGSARFAFTTGLRLGKQTPTAPQSDPDVEVPRTGFDLIDAFDAWKQTGRLAGHRRHPARDRDAEKGAATICRQALECRPMTTSEPVDKATDLGPRRQFPRRAAVAAGLSLLLFLGIAYGGWRLVHSPSKHNAVTCPSVTPSVTRAPAVPVRVLNGTGRRGLAGRTAGVLRQRGFRVAGVGNAARVAGRSEVRYGPQQASAARLVALQVPDARLVPDKKATKRVDIVLGGAFRRLRTPAEVAVATKAANLPSATPASAAPCP